MELFPKTEETIEGSALAIREGSRTCVEVVEQCLARIDEVESTIRAWVIVDREGALRQAEELDADLAEGKVRGPLHGIPIGIKDIVDVAGFPTAAGFDPWKDRIASEDAPIVARLRKAGAIILGKTVTTQFACYDPPPTVNPWNNNHTPGGSSSGSAAAVASGMCLGAIGSQTGGSITRPAAFCGIAGFKPSFGLLPIDGVVPIATHLDHPGPMARTVRDLAIMFDALSGLSLAERGQEKSKVEESSFSICNVLDELPSIQPTLGRLHGCFDEMADPEMTSAIDNALEILITAGAEIVDVELPASFEELHDHHRRMMAAEGATFHEQMFEGQSEHYGPAIRELVEEGLSIPVTEYIRARDHQEQIRNEMMSVDDKIDILVCPAALGPARDTSTTGNPAFNSPWSYTGFPTISFPIALSSNGLPMAIQLVGFFDLDPDLFCVASWCEKVIRETVG